MRWRYISAALWLAALPEPAGAQGAGILGACAELSEALRETCTVVAQATEAAQPQVGILLAGGNPTLGTASNGGLRLGVLPGVSATLKANLLRTSIPDLREVRTTPTDDVVYGDQAILAAALSATATVGLLPGISVAPTVRGIGSVDLLGTATWLPVDLFGGEGIRQSSRDLAYGVGARVGVLRESFTTPAIALSVLYHSLGTVALGEICPERLPISETPGDGYTLEQGQCAPTDPGDMGQLSFDLDSWSGRAVIGKHLLGIGLSGGFGYDRHASDIAIGVRVPRGPWGTELTDYAIVRDAELEQGRWSAFLNGSFSLLVATVAGEIGWTSGQDALSGFPTRSSDFDPQDGTIFGSVGLRVAL